MYSKKISHKLNWVVLAIVFFMIGSACGTSHNPGKSSGSVTLTLGAYTVPKEVYSKEIIPRFKKMWKEKTGEEVNFQESYMASGAQSRTIAAGFEADIAALSLEKDTQRLVEKGLITHDWANRNPGGFVTRSLVIMVLRPGNPLDIKDWQDLTSQNIQVIYPSPKTSGGAMWIINAIYGAGLKISEEKTGQSDPEFAYNQLKQIQERVKVMDKSGRASVTTFENGFGDVLLTYENEALLRQKQGKDFPFLIPPATILIENPIALVDKNVEKHGNRKVAEAFIDFLFTPEAQRCYAQYGFRPVDEQVLKEFADQYPTPPMLFDVKYMGGWEKIAEDIYGPEGVWTKIISELTHENQ